MTDCIIILMHISVFKYNFYTKVFFDIIYTIPIQSSPIQNFPNPWQLSSLRRQWDKWSMHCKTLQKFAYGIKGIKNAHARLIVDY